ncbi:hypothetical protein BH23CHL2_BH23CHL2_15160 [soil metagenome]
MLEHATADAGTLDAAVFESPDPVSTLESRLSRGWELIAGRESQGEPTDELFSHFLVLLQEYEDRVDAIAGQTSTG